MKKISRLAVILTLVLAMLFGMVNVCLAGPSTNGFSVWDTRITDVIDKSWSIKFNGLLATDTVNNNNIYIVDSNNSPVAVTLSISSDNAAVTIRPVSPYTVGNEYWLYVTKGVWCRGAGGQTAVPLSSPLVMPFIVAQDGYIQSIGNVYNTLLTEISVTTDSAVHSVSINGTNMIYRKNNKFQLGVAGLARSAKLIVKAYDSSGNLLQTLEYTIK